MYVHLGNETTVRSKDIIGIFDLETASVSKITREFLAHSEKGKTVINITNELPKSFVLANGDPQKVYVGQISSKTLKKRAQKHGKLVYLKSYKHLF